MSKSDVEWPNIFAATIVATFITFVVEQVFAGNLIGGYIIGQVGHHLVIHDDQRIMLIQPV